MAEAIHYRARGFEKLVGAAQEGSPALRVWWVAMARLKQARRKLLTSGY